MGEMGKDMDMVFTDQENPQEQLNGKKKKRKYLRKENDSGKCYFIVFMRRQLKDGFISPFFEYMNEIINIHPLEWLEMKSGAGDWMNIILWWNEIPKTYHRKYSERFRNVIPDETKTIEVMLSEEPKGTTIEESIHPDPDESEEIRHEENSNINDSLNSPENGNEEKKDENVLNGINALLGERK